MSAATTLTETVSLWTMGRNVSVSSLFPTPCNRDPTKSCRLCGERRSSETSEFAACGKAKDVQLATTRFRAAVLPQDKELETALFHRLNAKKCAAAGRRDIQFL